MTGLDGREEVEFFEAPVGVVGVDEVGDGRAEFLDVAVGSAVEELFFQGAVEALRHPIGLGLLDEGEAGGDPPVLDLVLEVVGEVLGAMIHAQRQATGHLRGDRAVEAREPLSDGLQRREPVALLRHMDAHALAVPVLDGREDPHPAVVEGDGTGAVGAPEDIGGVGGDGSLWAEGSAGEWRDGESRPCSRLRRSTRLRATRIPSRTRRRPQTLRWPSPVNGERARSARMAARSAVSEIVGLGPRRLSDGAGLAARLRWW